MRASSTGSSIKLPRNVHGTTDWSGSAEGCAATSATGGWRRLRPRGRRRINRAGARCGSVRRHLPGGGRDHRADAGDGEQDDDQRASENGPPVQLAHAYADFGIRVEDGRRVARVGADRVTREPHDLLGGQPIDVRAC